MAKLSAGQLKDAKELLDKFSDIVWLRREHAEGRRISFGERDWDKLLSKDAWARINYAVETELWEALTEIKAGLSGVIDTSQVVIEPLKPPPVKHASS